MTLRAGIQNGQRSPEAKYLLYSDASTRERARTRGAWSQPVVRTRLDVGSRSAPAATAFSASCRLSSRPGAGGVQGGQVIETRMATCRHTKQHRHARIAGISTTRWSYRNRNRTSAGLAVRRSGRRNTTLQSYLRDPSGTLLGPFWGKRGRAHILHGRGRDRRGQVSVLYSVNSSCLMVEVFQHRQTASLILLWRGPC